MSYPRMTWRELADFIKNEMPECNKDEAATVWNGGDEGKFFYIHSISPFDALAKPSENNYYSVDVNMDKDYF